MGGVTRTGMTLEELELEGASDEETLERRKVMYAELVERGIWKGNACGPVYDDDFEALAIADLAAAGPWDTTERDRAKLDRDTVSSAVLQAGMRGEAPTAVEIGRMVG